MRIIVTGASGQLGKALLKAAGSTEDELIGVGHSELDICQPEQVDRLLEQMKPDALINCAAYNAVDACENDEDYAKAFAVNVIGPETLAASCSMHGVKLVHLSTDYVFDGTADEPINESMPTNPINRYGYTKRCGEERVMKRCGQSFVVRTAWLYGEGKNFVRTILSLANRYPELKVVNDQFGTPTSAAELAEVLLKLVRTDAYGIYHATNEGMCSWYTFACKILEMTGNNARVIGVTSDEYQSKARRPHYSVLDNAGLKKLELNSFSSWEDALSNYLTGEQCLSEGDTK